MNEAVYSEMLGVIDDAIGLADCAVKAAEAAHRVAPAEPVTLVKVASSRYLKTAEALIKTGTFREYSRDGLAKSLESCGPAGLLEFMEKLASVAVFPFDAASALGGHLVEKSAKTEALGTRSGETNTDLWVRCCEDVGLSVRI